MHSFSDKDQQQIQQRGLTPETVNIQINNFINGFPYADLVGPAKVGRAIKSFDSPKIKELIKSFNQKAPGMKLLKFVPASGAASRMFKDFYTYINAAKDSDDEPSLIALKEHKSVRKFIENIDKFPFYTDLSNVISRQGLSIATLLEQHQYATIIEYLLTDKGLGYGSKPKALLKFHQYDDHSRLALEEHLVEGAYYVRNEDNEVHLHFTVSPEHEQQVKTTITRLLPEYEAFFGVKFHISYSTQSPATDVIAVDMNNNPIRQEDGSLLFRPGGHGALIDNLNNLDADLIFIKNIDNVIPDHLRDTTYIYKKILGSYLIELQEQTFNYLNQLSNMPEQVNLEEVRLFIQDHLGFQFHQEHYDQLRRYEKIDALFDTLNRPIRVCGMVKNQGEPGGGPFCVRHEDKSISLQIVEKAQVDTKKEDQRNYLESSSHFNPVDIVCSIKDFKGEPFDLKDFIDISTGIISHKSFNGKPIKAQERPGLWNGAMADWNTAFVEVPIITFNPVKTINDLLKKEHQPNT